MKRRNIPSLRVSFKPPKPADYKPNGRLVRLETRIFRSTTKVRVKASAFASSNERLAVALGRSAIQIASWSHGVGTIDHDVVIKARGLAEARNVNLDENVENV